MAKNPIVLFEGTELVSIVRAKKFANGFIDYIFPSINPLDMMIPNAPINDIDEHLISPEKKLFVRGKITNISFYHIYTDLLGNDYTPDLNPKIKSQFEMMKLTIIKLKQENQALKKELHDITGKRKFYERMKTFMKTANQVKSSYYQRPDGGSFDSGMDDYWGYNQFRR